MRKKVSLLAKHAQTALLLSPSIPPRSTSLAIWKGIVSSSHLTPLSLPLFFPFPSSRLFTCTFSLSCVLISRLIITPFLPLLCYIFFILFSSLLSNLDFFVPFPGRFGSVETIKCTFSLLFCQREERLSSLYVL